MVLYVVAGFKFNQFRSLQAMTDFLNQHHDAMISALDAKDYNEKHIMPALMEAGVCEYNPKTKEFHRCTYREAEVKVMQKVRDRKKVFACPGSLASGRRLCQGRTGRKLVAETPQQTQQVLHPSGRTRPGPRRLHRPGPQTSTASATARVPLCYFLVLVVVGSITARGVG
jgi:hypothetical protein